MKVTTEKLEKSQMALEVEVEPEVLERSLERAYRRIVNRANIPGFRRGKAPRHMVERYLGKSALLEEAIEILIPEAYSKALEEENISALGQPHIELLTMEPSVSFKATVALQPTVELGDYRQLVVEQETPSVTEEQVDSVLEDLRSRSAPWEPVERPVNFDDMLTIDVKGELEGQTYVDQKAAAFLVMKEWPVPMAGFPEQLVGMTKGGTKEFSLPVPADHPDPLRAGKDVSFKVTVSEVKEKKLPALDDEFAKSAGDGYDSLSTFKDKVREDLKNNVQQEARRALEAKVLDAVVQASTLEYPDVLLEHEIEHLIEDDRSIPHDSRGKIDDYLRASGLSEEEFRTRYREEATNRVVRSLVLNKVTEAEQITVTPEEIDAEIERMLEASGEQQEALRGYFNTEQSRESIGRMLIRKKTLDHLIGAVAKMSNGAKATAKAKGNETKSPPAGKGRGRKKAESTEAPAP